MAQPVAYARAYSFTDWQSANPTDPLPGDEVDGEFDAVGNSISSIRANMALLQRDDGALANGIVHPASLSTATKQLFAAGSRNFRGEWATGTAYALGDLVHQSDEIYICVVAHTAGTFATDLAALKWIALGVGSGGLGIYTPEQYGAVGNGVADDTTALNAMFRAAPNKSVIRLTPGAVYGIGETAARPYNPFVEGTTFKSVTVIAYGATIKSLYDSRYNQIFFEGGTGTDEDPDTFSDFFYWFGGTFDGNNQEQQYPPSVPGNYPDSPVGNLWREANGNRGMIGVRAYRHILFDGVELKNPVRDGIVAENFNQAAFRNIVGFGAIPFQYHEMENNGQTPREGAYIKTRLSASTDAFSAASPLQIVVDRCQFLGGCMGLFHRTNHKSAIEPSTVLVSGMDTKDMARASVWVEDCDVLIVDDSRLHGEYFPTDPYRGRQGGLFIGAVRRLLVDKSEIRNGGIECNNASSAQQFVVRDCYIHATSQVDSEPVIGPITHLIGTRIRSEGGNAVANVRTFIGGETEILEGGAVLLTRDCSVDGLRLGREIQEYETMTLTAGVGGAASFDLLAEDPDLYSIFEVFYVAAGQQPEYVPQVNYTYNSGTGVLTLDGSTNAVKIPEGEHLKIRYVAKTVDEFEAASGTTFDTSIRASSIVSVTVAGAAKTLTTDYTLSRNSDNTVRVTLLVAASSEDVVITSLPWWKTVVGTLTCGPTADARLANIVGRGFRGIRVRGPLTTIDNCDLQLVTGDDGRGAVFLTSDGAAFKRVTMRGGRIGRCDGNAIQSENSLAGIATIEIDGVEMFDFGLDNTLTDADARCAIGGRNDGFNGKHLRVLNSTFEAGRSEIGASDIAIRTRGSTLTSVEVAGLRNLGGMNATPLAINAVVSGGRRIFNGGLYGTGAYDPDSMDTGERVSTTITVTGAELLDTVVASFSLDLQGIELIAYVSAADTVTVAFLNNTGGTINLGGGTIRVTVFKSMLKLV